MAPDPRPAVPRPADLDARFLEEHHASSALTDGDERGDVVLVFGDSDLLPPSPGELCDGCHTPIVPWEATGWIHELGFVARSGCAVARPMVMVL